MNGFTPGPWAIGNRVNYFIDIFHTFGNVKGAITHALCRVQSRDSWIAESEANARLIAAAPDLLSHLTRLYALIPHLTKDAESRKFVKGELDDVKRLIAKATGQAS